MRGLALALLLALFALACAPHPALHPGRSGRRRGRHAPHRDGHDRRLLPEGLERRGRAHHHATRSVRASASHAHEAEGLVERAETKARAAGDAAQQRVRRPHVRSGSDRRHPHVQHDRSLRDARHRARPGDHRLPRDRALRARAPGERIRLIHHRRLRRRVHAAARPRSVVPRRHRGVLRDEPAGRRGSSPQSLLRRRARGGGGRRRARYGQASRRESHASLRRPVPHRLRLRRLARADAGREEAPGQPFSGFEDFTHYDRGVATGERDLRYPLIADWGSLSTFYILPSFLLRQVDLVAFADGARFVDAHDPSAAVGGRVLVRIALWAIPMSLQFQVARRLTDDEEPAFYFTVLGE